MGSLLQSCSGARIKGAGKGNALHFKTDSLLKYSII